MTLRSHSEHTLDEFLEFPGARKYEGYVALRCPWHKDAHPSLFVYPDNFFRCVSDDCGQMGTHEKLWRKLKNFEGNVYVPERTYRPPQVPLNNLAKFSESCYDMLNQYPYRKDYLTDRGIRGMIDHCKIGWYEGWYTIPVHDQGGEVKGMVLRSSPATQEKSGLRFVQPFGQKPMPFIPDRSLLTGEQPLYVVFGMFDALILAELGFPVITTTGAESTFAASWLHMWRLPVVVVPDKGGEKVAYDISTDLGWRGHILHMPYPDDCKDPNDYAQTGRTDELIQILREAQHG